MFKQSQFNNIILDRNNFYLFNAWSNAILKFNIDKLNNLQVLLNQPKTDGVEIDNLSKMGFIVNSKLDEYLLVEQSFQKNKFVSDKLTLALFPTFTCNLQCSYCTIKKAIDNACKNDTDMYFDNIFKLIGKSDKKHKVINILGGEPSLFMDSIVSFALRLDNMNKLGINQINVISNGSILLTHRQLEDIAMYNINFQFTIDGTRNQHDNSKSYQGAYDNLIDNVNNILAITTHSSIVLRFNISKTNFSDLGKAMSELKHKILHINKLRIYPAFIDDVNKNGVTENCLNLVEQNEALSVFYSLCKANDINYIFSLNSLKDNCSFLNENTLCIDPELLIFKCDNDLENKDLSIGTLVDGCIIYHDLMHSGRLRHFKHFNSSLISLQKCRLCSWLPVCRSGCPLQENKDDCQDLMKAKALLYLKFGNLINNKRADNVF